MQIKRTSHTRTTRHISVREPMKEKKVMWQNVLFSAILLGVIVLCVYFLKAAEEPKIDLRITSELEAANVPQASAAAQKIRQPDDPLLVLVNRDAALPADYRMAPRQYGNILVDNRIYESLVRMIDDARADDVVLWVASGYRSVEEQQDLLDRAAQENIQAGYDAATAMRVARQTIQLPGYSEHHTGLAVDFNTVSDSFADTEEYRWLQAHAADYGFVQRYTVDKEDITGIDAECWHYRYVGTENAKEMQTLGLCLEEYCALQTAGHA